MNRFRLHPRGTLYSREVSAANRFVNRALAIIAVAWHGVSVGYKLLTVNSVKAVALHCRAGIGRSSLVAVCVLVLLGVASGTEFDLIGKARGLKVPDTEEQRDWVDEFRETITTGGIHPA
ncbi:MAG: hypothetical protein ACREDT_02475 [Methylocella sp.]